MTMTTANIHLGHLDASPRLLRRAKAWLVGRRVARNAMNELLDLRSRDLADLGISSSDIPRLAREAGHAAAQKYLAA